jgi:uncharacterized membrane protein
MLMIVLRLIHVLAGVFWAGSVIFVAAFLIPAVAASGPGGGQVIQQVMAVLKYPRAAGIAAVLTILAGGTMYWHDMKISTTGWAGSAPGITYGIGALSALVAFTVFLTTIRPTGNKLLEFGRTIQTRGGPPTPEESAAIARLQVRMSSASRAGAAFLAITVAAMAIARYL